MPPRPLVSLAQAVAGLTLFASIALPLTPNGHSLLEILLALIRQSPVGAVTFVVMFASPQLFGLAVAGAYFMRDEQAAVSVVQLPLAILQAMIFMLGVSLIRAPGPVAALGFMGFALVTSSYYVYASGEAAASPRERLSLRWLIRWGALLIAATGLWLRLQALRGLHLGVGLDVAIAAAVLLLALTARAPERAPTLTSE